ncbi:MAG: formylglycine-generating enzyme family protein [Leptolyngbyaceae cyanobacterium]
MSESLSPLQRLKLIDLVNALMQPDFEKLVFAIAAPAYLIPSNFSAQGNRSSALLQWVESPTGCGLAVFLETLEAIVPEALEKLHLSPPKTPVQTSTPSSAPISEPPAPPASNVDFNLDLGSGITLEMVYIPGGRFWMGAPDDELERDEDESPQHKVTVPPFCMGKYPVTQRQWRAVSLLDDVERHLSPNPANFKGDDLPVEQVSWYEALEFCNRLSSHHGHPMRLPTEAEWEYACRAGTDTPFHFGNTISPDQVNYDANYIYGNGNKGTYREKTTSVGNFSANGFGLYDMHGNVWEWCQDVWHPNYKGAPSDGSAWVTGGTQAWRILRSGSWFDHPRDCRSASRSNGDAEEHDDFIGFRVCCTAPRKQATAPRA